MPIAASRQAVHSIYHSIHIYDGFRLMNPVHIIIHNHSIFKYHISIPYSSSYFLFKVILNLCTYFIYSFTYTHSCTRFIYSFMYTFHKLIHVLISYTHSCTQFIYSFMYSFHILIHVLISYTHSCTYDHIYTYCISYIFPVPCLWHVAFHILVRFICTLSNYPISRRSTEPRLFL